MVHALRGISSVRAAEKFWTADLVFKICKATFVSLHLGALLLLLLLCWLSRLRGRRAGQTGMRDVTGLLCEK